MKIKLPKLDWIVFGCLTGYAIVSQVVIIGFALMRGSL